ACLGENLIKHQVRKVKDADGKDTGEKVATGMYGAAYLRKKAEYLERGWTKNHAHRAAHRYMEKLAIKDLWRAWRGQGTSDFQRDDAPPTHSPQGDDPAFGVMISNRSVPDRSVRPKGRRRTKVDMNSKNYMSADSHELPG